MTDSTQQPKNYADERIAEFLGDFADRDFGDSTEEVKDETTTTEEESKTTEPTQDTQPVVPETAEPAVESTPAVPTIDAEKLVDKVFDKVAERDAKKVEEAQPKTPRSRFSWDESKGETPKSYTQIAEEAVQIAKQELAIELENRQRTAREEFEAQQKQLKVEQEAMNKKWDSQLGELRKAGYIPEVKNRADKEDPGVKAEAEILKTAFDNKEYDMEKVYLKFIAPTKKGGEESSKKKVVPGADAPISGTSKAVSADRSDDYSYEDIHNANLEDLYRA